MLEEANKEFDEMLNDVMGGATESDHSPEQSTATDNSLATEDAPEEKETFIPYGDEEDNSFSDDSAEQEAEKKEDAPAEADSAQEKESPPPDAEKVALQEKVTNYEKRLQDTQRAMHKANEERAKLQKELDALKQQKAEKGDDDNWFAEDKKNDSKTEELESKINALEEKQKSIQQEQALNKWLEEADDVAKKHPDFNELVFEKLEPLLDETTGDPAVLAAYTKWQDKTPSGAYEFARRYFRAEQAPAEKAGDSNNKTKAEQHKDPTTGKAGLDRINSAEFAEPKRQHGNLIDEVFG